MLLLSTNRKAYMWNPIPPSHLTVNELERSKLSCRKLSKIDICIVRYCVRVDPRFQLIQSACLQKIDNVIPTAAVK